MKKERVHISSLVIFVYYLRGLSSAGKQKYLPIFAAFCEHKKRYYQTFLFILWINGMKKLTYPLPESAQTSVLFVCSFPMRCKSSWGVQI